MKEHFIDDIKGKRIGVLGLGRSNLALIRFLSQWDVDITACDRKSQTELSKTYEELSAMDVKLSLGEGYMDSLDEFHIIFKTPGMPNHLPQLISARKRGTLITSEIDLFMQLCPAPVIGITGSDGKTTTTILIGRFLEAAGIKRFVGGNIGTPLIEKVSDIDENSVVVLEMSSFQLQTIRKSPNIGIVLNLSPNHLDIHKNMEEYIDAKKNIYRHQGPKDFGVFNYENAITQKMANEAPYSRLFFSRKREVQEGTFLRDGMVIARFQGKEEALFPISEIRLRGDHNVENVLAATCGVLPYRVGSNAILSALRDLLWVEHRLELVRDLNGVKYYNDSIASSPTRTINGLNSFERPIILIAGGYDKHLDFNELAHVIVDKVKSLILIGATADKIQKVVEAVMEQSGKSLSINRCDTLEDAVILGASAAEEGDIVLLSPACASFDMFKDFEERGKRFKEIVMGI